MLDTIAPGFSSSVLVGFDTSDDAAVYQLSDDSAALLTVDFFTPIVDDPYDFGRITAANALSDVYAMGGKPLTALNIIAFPCSLGPDVVAEVLRGGAEKVVEAGAVIVGGHTIDDKEPKYGMSVFGTVHPRKIWRNSGAQSGDVLVLTKPIGTGIWGTALKRGLVDERDAVSVIDSMATLNKLAAEQLDGLDVHACTDITGFGLLGHIHEMMMASDRSAILDIKSVPMFERVWELASREVVPGRTYEVIEWASKYRSYDQSIESDDRAIWDFVLCDPQTSGGLLIALSPDDAESYLAQSGLDAYEIGRVSDIGDDPAGTIRCR